MCGGTFDIRPILPITADSANMMKTSLVLSCCLLSFGVRAQTISLVDIGGLRLEVAVAGQGVPVVVLEAGLGEHRMHWAAIQDSVASFTTVVAYSRAGYGTSEQSQAPRTPLQVMAELHTLLDVLDVPGPYLMVGQSLGGIYVRVFARQYPDDVAGLVLVDPAHERGMQLCSELSQSSSFWPDLRRRFDRAAESIQGGMSQELDELWRIWRRGTLPEAEPLSDIPLIVLTAFQPDASWVCTSEPNVRNIRRLHAEHFERTTNGAHIVTTASGHNMHRDQPGLVIESIRRMVQMLR